jgi:hypothetical protein
MTRKIERYRYIQSSPAKQPIRVTPFLQPAALIEDVGQPWDAVEASSLLACWRQCNIVKKVQLRLGVFARLKVKQQVVLHSEYSVIGHPWVVAGVELSDQWLVTFGRNHEMDVCGAEGVAVHGLEELTSSTCEVC